MTNFSGQRMREILRASASLIDTMRVVLKDS